MLRGSIAIAPMGQMPMHPPQPLQISTPSSGTNGPPMRGRKRMACMDTLPRMTGKRDIPLRQTPSANDGDVRKLLDAC